MKAADVADTKRVNRDFYAASAAESLFTEIERLIQASRPNDSAEPALDRGGQVRRTNGRIKSLLQQSPASAASENPTADHASMSPPHKIDFRSCFDNHAITVTVHLICRWRSAIECTVTVIPMDALKEFDERYLPLAQ